MKRIIAGCLAVSTFLTLCGCGKKNGGKTYFDHDVWRGDVAYSEMEYERYQAEWFDEYTKPMYTLAQKGGDRSDFKDADYELTDEFYYVYTLYQLAQLASSADPTNKELADETLYAQEMSYKMYEEYRKAMREIARSDHKSLMDEIYSDEYIPYFTEYEETSDEEYESRNEENALVSRYYALIAEDEPDYDAIGEIYVSLVKIRQARMENSSYDNYADYAYECAYTREYTPEKAQAIWAGVKKYFAPLSEKYKEKLSESAVTLFADENFDTSSEAVLKAMGRVLPDFSWELNEAYQYMLDYELYDIVHDPSKSNIDYTITLYYYNQPYIFVAAYDEFVDYTSVFHEFGHFANAYYTIPDLLYGYSDNDLCELQAQGMEIMMTHYYDKIFGTHSNDALDYVLSDMLYSVIDGAMYDEFQYRVYREENLTLDRVNEIYAEVYESYGYVPYDGYEHEWMDIGHNFDHPFYYISYAVSAMGALEFYDLAQENWDTAVDKYLTVSAMDPEIYYYSEAVDKAGLADIFSDGTYKDIAEALETAFQR